jgi:threonine dehydrogenase-like Zn-dependent dehydrogenase
MTTATGQPSTPVDVLIVGAGPVGLACAIELGSRGIRCLVIERNDRVRIARTEGPQDGRQKREMSRDGQPYGYRALRGATQLIQFIAHPAHLFDDQLRPQCEGLSKRGCYNAPRTPLEQRCSDLALKLCKAAGECGLGDIEITCGRPNAAGIGDRNNFAEMLYFHSGSLRCRFRILQRKNASS